VIDSLQFNFLGHRCHGVTHLADNGLQRISGNVQPPGPCTDLARIGQVNLVANRRMFDAMHGGIPSLNTNGIRGASFHLPFDRPTSQEQIRQRPPEGGPVVQLFKVREDQS
jgi:hypothetical protein